MKNSDEWVRQSDVDQAANELLLEHNGDMSKVRGYAVAQRLGCKSASQSIYTKVEIWRQRQVGSPLFGDVVAPKSLVSAISTAFEAFKAQLITTVGTEFETCASNAIAKAEARVSDAERRVTEKQEDMNDLISHCEKVELECDVLNDRNRELEDLVQSLRQKEQQLEGKVQVLMALVPSAQTALGEVPNTEQEATLNVTMDDVTEALRDIGNIEDYHSIVPQGERLRNEE